MKLLGAVLAGGESRRFGSDKALADLHGLPLIEHARRGLAAQVDAVVICGRAWGRDWIADRPRPGMGPLGGISAALHDARARDFDAVLTVPCDAPLLPPDLRIRLEAGGAAAFLAEMPVIGLWPASLAEALEEWMRTDTGHSVREWGRRAGAVPVQLGSRLHNVNTRPDLAALRWIVPE